MRNIFFCILFSISFIRVFAQEQFIEKPAKYLTRFPFKQLSGGIMLVRAQLNNLPDSFNFILDTGSGGISLDSATCFQYNIPHVPSGRSINGIAGIRDVDFSKNNALNFPGLKVNGLDFYINDYEILTSVYGEKIDGIIGYSFFSRYIIKINFDSTFVEVYEPGFLIYPREGTMLHPVFTALPIQNIRIKDARTLDENFYLDTGAGLSFLLTQAFTKDSGFIQKRRKPVTIQVEGMGGKKTMLLTIIKEIKLGPYKFRRVPTHLLDDEFNAISYPFVAGLIGNDILRRFNLIFNYVKREVHLTPNTHFEDAFDYSYTGLSIYSIDGEIVIDDIITGSPAYKAGFKKNDIIIAVNNNFSNDINLYKNIIQTAGERVRVLLLRNNKPVIIDLRVGKIF